MCVYPTHPHAGLSPMIRAAVKVMISEKNMEDLSWESNGLLWKTLFWLSIQTQFLDLIRVQSRWLYGWCYLAHISVSINQYWFLTWELYTSFQVSTPPAPYICRLLHGNVHPLHPLHLPVFCCLLGKRGTVPAWIDCPCTDRIGTLQYFVDSV